MIVKDSKFIKSTTKSCDFPSDGLKEVAIVGRSNVGKSSIINSMLNRKRIAKVSSSPGKTKTINFFLINNDMYLVDFPGYGYAKTSKMERNFWKDMIESYFYNREVLKKVILLIDSRHKPFESDINMYNWVKYLNYGVSIVATKSDKIKYAEQKRNEKLFKEVFKTDNIFFYSSFKNEKRDELLEFLFGDI